MSKWFHAAIVTSILFLGASAGVAASQQSTATKPSASPRDLSGVWKNGSNLLDLSVALGRQTPFTAYGLERFQKIDLARDPTGYCLPYGPARALFIGLFPFQFVQTSEFLIMLFENQTTFRIVYLDGRDHPKDIQDYLSFMGHSIGKWEGDTLVVDTVGIDKRTWLDHQGHEHEQLHLIERFQRSGPETINYAVTFEDPVFYKEPFTVSFDLQAEHSRIMPFSCLDNEKDLIHLQPTFPNAGQPWK